MRKKVLISHRANDKNLVNELEKILHFCGFDKNEILYTSSQYPESTIQSYTDIYEYLKKFFVNTVIQSDLCVIYVINKAFIKNWNTVLEAGAGWVLNSAAYIMYTDSPQNVKAPFSNSMILPRIANGLSDVEISNLATAIHTISEKANKNDKSIADITKFIKTSTSLR